MCSDSCFGYRRRTRSNVSIIAALSRSLESALAADFNRLRSLRGSFAPACSRNAATARTFLTLFRDSCTALSNLLPALAVSARAALRSSRRTILASSCSMCFRWCSSNDIRSRHVSCTHDATHSAERGNGSQPASQRRAISNLSRARGSVCPTAGPMPSGSLEMRGSAARSGGRNWWRARVTAERC